MSLTVDVDVYPSGITTVYNGGTIATSSRLAVPTAPDDQEPATTSRVVGRTAVHVMGTLPTDPDDDWPPSWFGSIRSERTDISARTREILRDEFGRDDHR